MAKLTLEEALKKARSYSVGGQIHEAQRLYETILRTFPKNEHAQRGLETLRTSSRRTEADIPLESAIKQLENLYNQGLLEATKDQARRLTAKYPEEFIIWNILGAACGQSGDLDQAIVAFEKVISLKPNYPAAYNNLGIALKGEGRIDDALEAFTQAISRKPDFAEAFNNMGTALIDLGKLAAAKDALAKAVSLKPDFVEAYNNMGHVLTHQGKFSEAIQAYEKSLSFDPKFSQAYVYIGDALRNQGQLNTAIEIFEKSIAINPHFLDAYIKLGNALKEQGKLIEAVATYEKALEREPNFVLAYNNLGVVLREQGKLTEAIEAYNKALSLDPNYQEAYRNILNILKENNSPDNALTRIPPQTLLNATEVAHALHASCSNEELAHHLQDAFRYMNEIDFDFKTPLSQIYKRSSRDLNCARHKKIFDAKDIIPEFCFGCFKVQVEVDDLFSLIRLTRLFYDFNFEEDLNRKTMIEMRPDVSGFYKGLFYCRGLEQAHLLKDRLDNNLKDIFYGPVISQIKRGCSEFPAKFPDYSKINSNNTVAMAYKADWRSVEDQFDKDNSIKAKQNVIPSRAEFCLSDFYVIRKWIDYARGLDDPSCSWFKDEPILFKQVYETAVQRKEKFGKFR